MKQATNGMKFDVKSLGDGRVDVLLKDANGSMAAHLNREEAVSLYLFLQQALKS